MRRIGTTEQDQQALQLLKEGAEAAAGHADLNKKVTFLMEQNTFMRYSLSRVLNTLATYPAVKEQLDQLDYRTLGIARALGELQLTPDFNALVEKHAKQARVDVFVELSDADDKKNNLAVADDEAITDQHWVILTSECPADADQGIFRSKMDVGGEEFAVFKDSFLGKKVGETVETKIQGKDHLVTILGLRKKPSGDTSDASKKD